MLGIIGTSFWRIATCTTQAAITNALPAIASLMYGQNHLNLLAKMPRIVELWIIHHKDSKPALGYTYG